jgi:hypothetical protein
LPCPADALFPKDKALSGIPGSFISGETNEDEGDVSLPLAKPPIVPLPDVLRRRIGAFMDTILDVKSPLLPAFKAIIPGSQTSSQG